MAAADKKTNLVQLSSVGIHPGTSRSLCQCVFTEHYFAAPDLPASMLPLGMTAADNKTKLVQLEPGPTLVHRVLSVSSATQPTEDIVQTNVAGFIVV